MANGRYYFGVVQKKIVKNISNTEKLCIFVQNNHYYNNYAHL